MPPPAFLAPLHPPPPRRPRPARCTRRPPTCMTALPTQERVLRLERALAAAVLQERYNDAANLRDALVAARTSDPLLAKRAELQVAVQTEDFLAAAKLRDDLAALTELFSKGDSRRRVNRIIVLRGRGDPETALRVATVSREGHVQLPLIPERIASKPSSPSVYLQPTWSPSGDFVAMTEISFNIELPRPGRGLAIADSSSRIIIMNAFDGTVIKSVPLVKPPFFYFWSPDGRCVTLLSNDPTASVTAVALSVIQVVAPPGAGGLDMDSVTGPLASGHPFLYDFCPRDSTRVIAHMGDTNTVAIVPISPLTRAYKFISTTAGAFGAPQWHPSVGTDGRETLLFVEKEDRGEPRKEERKEEEDSEESEASEGSDDLKQDDQDEQLPFEKFIANGTTLLESVLRKGAESLGLTPRPDLLKPSQPDETSSDDSEPDDDDSEDTFGKRFNRLLPRRPVTPENDHWMEQGVAEAAMNRLIMCDAENPELKKTIARFSGVMAFKLSPNGQSLTTLVTNPATGDDELRIMAGDFSPDTVAEEEQLGYQSGLDADVILSTPYTRVLAFFWSPDARKLLFLTSLRGSRVGAAQWATYSLDTKKVVRYEKFVISGIYMHCLNFFDQFAASMTPWSPDSDAFCYPGRPLTKSELEKEQSQATADPPALSALFMQRDGNSDAKRFSARVQKFSNGTDSLNEPEDAVTIVDNVEYACWSPC